MSEQDQIDPRENPESQVAESTASQTGTRSGQGGVVMSDAPTAEEGAERFPRMDEMTRVFGVRAVASRRAPDRTSAATIAW